MERTFFKYNENDILEIITEYLAEKSGYKTFNSKAIFLGSPGKDLRLITIVGSLEDREIDKINIDSLDEKMDFNGTHNGEYYKDAEVLLKSIDDAIKKGDF